MQRLTADELAAYQRDGYHVARAVFRRDEMADLARHFDELAAAGQPIPGHWEPKESATRADDPLARYPRVMNPHQFSAVSRRYYLDPRLQPLLESLLGDEPVAISSMFYWKPPGARGQAFHQDNYYARVKPATCIAAWQAVDPATTANGGLVVVPGTQALDIQCPEVADENVSFHQDLVRPPSGQRPVAVDLQSGDVLFFEGGLIHGSEPNRSPTLWRRSHVCHYMRRDSTHAAQPFLPALDFAGQPVDYICNGDEGPCGGREGSAALAVL